MVCVNNPVVFFCPEWAIKGLYFHVGGAMTYLSFHPTGRFPGPHPETKPVQLVLSGAVEVGSGRVYEK